MWIVVGQKLWFQFTINSSLSNVSLLREFPASFSGSKKLSDAKLINEILGGGGTEVLQKLKKST